MEKITILKAPKGKLTKKFTMKPGASAPEKTAYDDVVYFIRKSAKVDGIKSLFDLLSKLSDRHDACVIRGALRPEEVVKKSEQARLERVAAGKERDEDKHALFKKGKTDMLFRRCKAVFEDTAQSWVAFDVDGYDAVFDDPADIVQGVKEYIEEILGGPFQGIDHVIQLTSSAGLKPGLRCRVWFWLDQPVFSGHWYAWCKGKDDIDAAVFRPVQVHYTASPIFEGMDDPIGQRTVFVEGGLGDCVPMDELTMPEYDPIEADAAEHDGEPGDAYERPGIEGVFNKHVPISELIDEHLAEHFEIEGGSRVTWLGSASGTPGGCRILDGDTKLFNSHASNPHPTEVANAFELVKTYLFEGDVAKADKWVRKNYPNVATEYETLRREQAASDFEDEDAEIDEWVRELNGRYAVVNCEGKAMVFRRSDEQGRYTLLDQSSFCLLENQKITVPIGKKCMDVPMGKTWLEHEHRRAYREGFTYVVDPKPGEVHPGRFNLWQRPEWMDADLPENVTDDEVAPWLNLVRDLMPGEDDSEYFIQRVMAFVHEPAVKRRSAVILQGGQGVGKDTVLTPLRYLVGYMNYRSITTNMVCSDFNDWARGARLCVLAEIDLSNRRDVMDKLKDMITGDELTINAKFQNRVSAPNVIEFFGTTNHENALALEGDDRRYWVYGTKFTAAEFLQKHEGVHGWMKDEANLLKLVGWLKQRKYNRALVNGIPPLTEAKRNMVEMSMSPIEIEIQNLFDEHHADVAGNIISLKNLTDTLAHRVGSKQRVTPALVGSYLRNRGYIFKDRVRIGVERHRVYVVAGSITDLNLSGQALADQYIREREKSTQDTAAQDFFEDEA